MLTTKRRTIQILHINMFQFILLLNVDTMILYPNTQTLTVKQLTLFIIIVWTQFV